MVNGDTLFRVDLGEMITVHNSHGAACTLALKPMHDFDRYGAVGISGDGAITAFQEKKFYSSGLINGGVYLLDLEAFRSEPLPEKFSFEKDYLETGVGKGRFYAVVQDSYFIDIGIPEDYRRVNEELTQPALDLSKIDSDWTLFLDRDGVLNEDKVGSYIFNPNELIFYEGVPEAFELFSRKFRRIIIATNQRGVGKELMTVADLDAIHEKLLAGIEEKGGRIDAIFYASSTQNDDPIRKPNVGMARAAKQKFPEIDLSKSIMIGNNLSDMEFGRNAGMYTIFLKTTIPDIALPLPEIDLAFDSLRDFAKAL